ncbi:MAG TPA: hypothetical protein VGQ75_05890 [Thermoanaerobaculia bacterium]|jgi:hypothetical protein|nr:hypothetical protein [Thermoanaerobaculia bacterium]
MRRLLIGSALLFLVACTGGTPTSPETARGKSVPAAAPTAAGRERPGTRVVAPRPTNESPIPLGLWGGNHVSLLVTETGGSLEYDCAHGKIGQPLVADSAGRFDLSGTHTREHGGPIREDEKADTRPARYRGTTDGRTMTLTVTLTDSNEDVGTFTLKHGKVGRIVKCL